MTFPRVNNTNWGFGGSFTSAQVNRLDQDHAISASDAQMVQTAISNFGLAYSAATMHSGAQLVGAAYDANTGTWRVATNANAYPVYYSNDGFSWNQDGGVPSLGSAPIAIGAGGLASSPNFAVVQGSSSSYAVMAFGTTSYSAGIPATAATVFWFAPASEYLILSAKQGVNSYSNGALYKMAAAAAPTSAVTLPTAWQSGSTNIGQFLFASSPTETLVALCGASASDTSRIGLITYPSSVLTFADVTPTTLAGQQVTGIAWDAFNSVWVMTAISGAGTATYYTSVDPPTTTSWTTAYTAPAGVSSGGLAAVAGVWISSMTTTGYGSTYRTMLTRNLGSSWAFGKSFQDNVPLSYVSSGSQILAWDSIQVALSNIVGYP